MNLFILSLIHKQCAIYMIDKHISKMILEAVQMLCSAKRILDPNEENEEHLYKIAKSHINHPVTIWIRTSLENYIWTLDMVDAMHEEWQYRYQHTKEHKSYTLAKWLRENPPSHFPETGLTPFALAMPDEHKTNDPVESYRNYYRTKASFASWKRREKPEWF
jgi:hypothetical protein